jgi:YHS domain-containing protein
MCERNPFFQPVQCPVCGVDLDPDTCRHRSVYEGMTYYFSSAECKRAFDVDPDLYAEDSYDDGVDPYDYNDGRV